MVVADVSCLKQKCCCKTARTAICGRTYFPVQMDLPSRNLQVSGATGRFFRVHSANWAA